MKKDRHPVSMILTAFSLIVLILPCIIHPSAVEGAEWETEELLESFLLDNYPWSEIEVRNVRMNGDAGKRAPEEIVVEKGPIGNAVFSFLSEEGGRVIVKADVRAYGKVVRSKRPYRRGHIIDLDDLYISKMDIRKMPGSAISDPESIVGKSLKRSMTANIPIVENMIQMTQVIKRGKRVVLMINQGGFNIMASGKTKEKGYVGMPVKAINLSSRKEVVGVLIDENTVEVEL